MSYKLRTTPAMELKLAKIKRFCEKQEIKKRNGNDMLLATISKLTSFVQYNRPSLPVLFWRVVFLNATLQDRQPAKPDEAVPRLV